MNPQYSSVQPPQMSDQNVLCLQTASENVYNGINSQQIAGTPKSEYGLHPASKQTPFHNYSVPICYSQNGLTPQRQQQPLCSDFQQPKFTTAVPPGTQFHPATVSNKLTQHNEELHIEPAGPQYSPLTRYSTPHPTDSLQRSGVGESFSPGLPGPLKKLPAPSLSQQMLPGGRLPFPHTSSDHYGQPQRHYVSQTDSVSSYGPPSYSKIAQYPEHLNASVPSSASLPPLPHQFSNVGPPKVNQSMNSFSPNNQVNGPISGGPLPPVSGVQSPFPYTQSLQQPPREPQYPAVPQVQMGAPAISHQLRGMDPNHLPSSVQVIEADRKERSGTFFTSTKGKVPPLVTTDFTVKDDGNCSPRFVRSTIYSVPTTFEMLKQTAVPFAITISPFAKLKEGEQYPPVSNLGEMGPVRCIRCKAYMCSFMKFIDGGRRFHCAFCKGITEVPHEYINHLDHMGQRIDKFQRPELCLGSYEYLTTKDYCKNGVFPKPPVFIFMIDVSHNSIRNGMVKFLCDNMMQVLTSLPKEVGAPASVVKVGFVTYCNVVHFYNVKGNLVQPQMLVVPDVEETFVPLLDGFFVTVEESQSVINSLADQIPQMFMDNQDTETILGPPMQAGLDALKAAGCAGKIFIFHSVLPIAEAPGKLKNRDDQKLLGTDKEKTLLIPQSNFYNNLGQECVTAGCCVDLFLFPSAYIDIATIGEVCRLSGGQVHKYSYFQTEVDGRRFLEDLKHSVRKTVAFDVIMRVRTSTGIRPTDFYGHYYMSNTTDVELAAVDEDKAITVEIKYDDKLPEEDGTYIQVAVLYTSSGGQRRLRVHNLELGTCSQLAVMYKNCELDTIINYFSKQGLRMVMEQTPRYIKDYFINRSAQMLATYKKSCADYSSPSQFILPDCMKLLPLYVNCLIKSDALSGVFSYALFKKCKRKNYSFSFQHDLDPNSTDFPKTMRCSIGNIQQNGAYLLENGIHMFMWIGMAICPDWLKNVLGIEASDRINVDKISLPQLNTPLSLRIHDIIESIRKERQRCMRLMIVCQGDKLELIFRRYLMEDHGTDGSTSYVDFFCHLHKEIQKLLS
ncbi:protein transport protein Sec24C-like [Limulus polyphemus]|uniref:Protein transport protein Sec24C-like n=1 Tax=Limulus polyphemus TaxID=6850 RepID=A0ABM1SZ54_LIMPO|nr:protein transport protein Sec24C-like [Limulus polyphemus]